LTACDNFVPHITRVGLQHHRQVGENWSWGLAYKSLAMWRSNAVVLPKSIFIVPLDAEDDGGTNLWNIASFSPSETAPHLRRLESAAAPLWEPEISWT
jgi:hypothetical protein